MSPPQEAAPGPSRGSRLEPSAAAVRPVPRRPEPPRWLVLAAIPALPDPGATMWVPGMRDRQRHALPGQDLAVDRHHAPRASYLLLLSGCAAPDPKLHATGDPRVAYVHAAAPSGCVLFHSATRSRCRGAAGADRPAFFVGDAHTGVAKLLPDAPASYELRPRRAVGLVADPRRRGAYVVAQLEPSGPVVTRHNTLLCYSTATEKWDARPLASAPEPGRRWGAHGVLAHDGLLWWVDVAYGLLVCDPFLDHPRLRFVPLPPGREIQGDDIVHRTLIDDRRIVRLSEGKLRYVEIRGDGGGFFTDNQQAAAVDEHLDNPILCAWTLADPDAQHPWDLEYEVPLADVWAHDTYIAAGLAPSVVPKLGLVHPYNRRIVYMFQGAKLFGLDVRTRRVLACQECRIGSEPVLRFQSSPYVHAWELPAVEALGDCSTSSAGAPRSRAIASTAGSISRSGLPLPAPPPPQPLVDPPRVRDLPAVEDPSAGRRNTAAATTSANDADAGAGPSPAVTGIKRKLEEPPPPAPAGPPPPPPPVEATAPYPRRAEGQRARIRRHLTGPFRFGDDRLFSEAANLIRDLLSTTVPIEWHQWAGEAQLRFVLPGGQSRRGRNIGLLTMTADFLDARHAV